MRPLAFLAVQVFFHQVPIKGLKVQFNKLGSGEAPGEAVGQEQKTDRSGIAQLDFPVPPGHYSCTIEGQPATIISTVHCLEWPFILVLPIGRPYFDFGRCEEYDSEEAPQEA